jgi:hypothetical protein
VPDHPDEKPETTLAVRAFIRHVDDFEWVRHSTAALANSFHR